VTADFPVNGIAAGENLASNFQTTAPGVWELKLKSPLATLPKGKLTVSVKDRQGNVNKIDRTFAVAGGQR